MMISIHTLRMSQVNRIIAQSLFLLPLQKLFLLLLFSLCPSVLLFITSPERRAATRFRLSVVLNAAACALMLLTMASTSDGSMDSVALPVSLTPNTE